MRRQTLSNFTVRNFDPHPAELFGDPEFSMESFCQKTVDDTSFPCEIQNIFYYYRKVVGQLDFLGSRKMT